MDTPKKTMGDDRRERPDVVGHRTWWKWWFFECLVGMLTHLVWVDETATYTHMTRTHARAPRGRRAYAKGRRKGRRYTLIAAMKYDGVIATRLVQGGMKRKDWLAFLTQDLLPALGQESYYIQMDNLDLHKEEELLLELRSVGHLYGFQPPYSPEANPIEEAFSLLKAHLRGRGAKGLTELREPIEQGVQLWTPERIDGWLRHTIVQLLRWPGMSLILYKRGQTVTHAAVPKGG